MPNYSLYRSSTGERHWLGFKDGDVTKWVDREEAPDRAVYCSSFTCRTAKEADDWAIQWMDAWRRELVKDLVSALRSVSDNGRGAWTGEMCAVFAQSALDEHGIK